MKTVELTLTPEEAFDENLFPRILFRKLSLPDDGSISIIPIKRSVDARSRHIVVRLQCEILTREEQEGREKYAFNYADVSKARRVLVVGSGPAGKGCPSAKERLGCDQQRTDC